jgi:hypothetical protein
MIDLPDPSPYWTDQEWVGWAYRVLQAEQEERQQELEARYRRTFPDEAGCPVCGGIGIMTFQLRGQEVCHRCYLHDLDARIESARTIQHRLNRRES